MRNPGVEGQPLSPGQLAALRLAASGYTSRQIAARLDTTEQGIHLRLKEACVRLGARSRTHAVVIALRRCVIRFDELELGGLRPQSAKGGPRTATDGPQRRREPAHGAPVVRPAPDAADGRTAAAA